MIGKPRAAGESQGQGGGIRPWAACLLAASLVVSAVMMTAAALTAHAGEADTVGAPSIPSESIAQADGPAEGAAPPAIDPEPPVPVPQGALPITRAKPLRGMTGRVSLPPAAVGQGWPGGVRLRLPFSGRAQITQGPHMGEALDFTPSEWGMYRWNGVVLAAGSGRVIFAGVDQRRGSCPVPGKRAGYGKLVVIEHAGARLTHSYYSHLASIQVQPGESVSMGQVIGVMGDTGCSSGPHLHFEVRQGVIAGTIRTGISIPIVGLPGIDLWRMMATGP